MSRALLDVQALRPGRTGRNSGQTRTRGSPGTALLRGRNPLSVSSFAASPGVGEAFPCAPTVLAEPAHWGKRALQSPHVGRLDNSFPAHPPYHSLGAAAGEAGRSLQTVLSELCFRNSVGIPSLVGERGFPRPCPLLALYLKPPPLPPRSRDPTFCLSAERQQVFIEAAAILRCARFQLQSCDAPHRTECARATVQPHSPLLRRSAHKNPDW